MRAPRIPPPPPAPDPVATASAQGAANVGTAIATQTLSMVDQDTPYGSLRYTPIESVQVPDGFGTGKDGTTNYYTVPRYRVTQTLSPEQQQLQDLSNQTEISLATTGRDQSRRIGDLLGTPIDVGGVPSARATIERGGPIRRSLGDTGAVTREIADAGPVTRGFAEVGGPRRQVGPADFSEDRRRVEEALYARLNPQLDRDRAALETRLVNAGYRRGSEGWDRAVDEANRQANDARMGVIRAGGEEQSRLSGLEFSRFDRENAAQAQEYGQARERGTFANQAQEQAFGQNAQRAAFANDAERQAFGEEQGRAAFENSAEQQAFNENAAVANYEGTARDRMLRELFATRNQPINEITALMSGSQVSQPNFTATPQTQVAGVDYSGIVQNNYNQAMQYARDANQQRIASQNAMMGGLFGLGGTLGYGALRFSDRRLKRDVERIGTGPRGLPLYRYRYLWSDVPEIGVMADETARVMPEAVVVMPGGFLAVDYAALEG